MTSRSSEPNSHKAERSRGARRPRRSRYEQERGDGNWLRLIVIVGAIGLAAAAILFWNRSGDSLDTEIGERLTVVTADSLAGGSPRPRSGSVAIAEHTQELVPERPEGAAPETARETTPTPERATDVERSRASAAESPPTERIVNDSRATGTEKVAEPAPTEPSEPSDEGAWALQVGAFGSRENADSLLERLRAHGYTPRLRGESSADGSIFYRVWIGYFPSRAAAERFARARRTELGDAFPVHR